MEISEILDLIKQRCIKVEKEIQICLDNQKTKTAKCMELIKEHNEAKTLPPEIFNIDLSTDNKIRLLINEQADLHRQLGLIKQTVEWYSQEDSE